ncbi:hypothetical protein MBLNU459_g7499t2 [Dothideomycetes sp. NU459]
MPSLGFLKKKRTKDDLNSPASPTKNQPQSPTKQLASPTRDSTPLSTPTSSRHAPSTFSQPAADPVPTIATNSAANELTPPTTADGARAAQPKHADSMQQSSAFQQQQQQPQSHPVQQNNAASIQNIINQPSQSQSAFASNGGLKTPFSNQAVANPMRETKGKYTLTDFTISRTLGTGSFGRVHLVQSKHNQRFYAVKVLKKAQVVKMKQVEHTNDERKMLQKVKHPFLVTLWGTFQDSKNLYMVMDFIEGGELFSLLRKSQRFPNPVAKFYAAEVTLALDYLHSLDIIYRDLKPENLLLDRHGHLKITDFGFAKEVPDITWTLCGTPDYLAPEVVSSKGYNKSVDWWSLGILIFEMLCGFTPFWDSGSPLKIYENILRGRVKYPPYVHPDAQDLLSKLITHDLTKRLGNLHGGSKDVMQHPWFAEVTWERLGKKDIDAPYVPPVKGGQGDASLFDKYAEDTEPYGLTGDDPHGRLFTEF